MKEVLHRLSAEPNGAERHEPGPPALGDPAGRAPPVLAKL